MEHANIGGKELLLIFFVMILFVSVIVIPFWMICKKAGFLPLLSLLILIPFVNILFIFYLGFADWPSLKQIQKNNQ